jgi:hypothetical protein
LPEGDREQATIKVNGAGGATYTADEIDRLHFAPKKKNARRRAALTANLAKLPVVCASPFLSLRAQRMMVSY